MLRAELPSECYPTIDKCLKSLQVISRRATTLCNILKDEAHLLNQLYYKNNNQHRAALFWHRISQIRRLLNRQLQDDATNFYLQLPLAFYKAGSSPNVFRMAWTNMPQSQDVKKVQKSLRRQIQLHTKTLVATQNTSRLYLHHIKSSAFLPLILSLYAITSRIHVASGELQTLEQQFAVECSAILHIHQSIRTSNPSATLVPEQLIGQQQSPRPTSVGEGTSETQHIQDHRIVTPSIIVHKVHSHSRKKPHKGPQPLVKDALDEIFGF